MTHLCKICSPETQISKDCILKAIASFEVRIENSKIRDYLNTIMELKTLLQGIISFIRVKQFIIAEGKPLILSICKDKANITKWCNILEYRKSQEARCNEYFVGYTHKNGKNNVSLYSWHTTSPTRF